VRLDLPPTSPNSPAEPDGSQTVLVVDDLPIVRGAVRAMLEAGGYCVLEAADGAEALRVAEQHAGRIDLLMSDVVMPGMRGPELAERLVARFPGLRVVLTSGYAEDAPALTGATFLQKPFTAAELAEKLREALDERLVA
jgi:two-component system, cell cycle sensor histidine kinase and response regulator CckA